MVFQWDSTKAATNLRKHKIDFHEAATVLKDVLSMTYPDVDHSNYEQRYVTIGISDRKRILVVAHADGRKYPNHKCPQGHRPRTEVL